MAPLIHILPDHLANKIAAGEVVQRPESVIKELLENSIDAGSASVTIIIKEGGKSLIKIVDDGCGMSAEDAELSFYRHATSKISTYEDIENIRTLGFRGEALASIAAVGHVELRTKPISQDVGTMLRIEGGEIKSREQTSMNHGTSVAVRNLFYNTPARRQFLKSTNTEFKHVYDAVQRLALSHPEIAVEFISNEEQILVLRASNLEQRLKDLYGDRHYETLIQLKESNEYITVTGYIGKPDFARKTRVDQYLYLNNRFIINRTINHAIYSGYERLVEKGNFPFFILFLEINPRKVDVNVHPSKMEVKFSDEQTIYRFVMSVVRKTLARSGIIPGLRMETSDDIDPSLSSLRHSNLPRFYAPDTHHRTDAFPVPLRPEVPRSAFETDRLKPSELEKLFLSISRETGADVSSAAESGTLGQHASKEINPEEFTTLWQLHDKYILTPIRSGLLIVDQHVAHERILYERALTAVNNQKPMSQQLLFSHTVQLNAGDFQLVQELIPHLLGIGFQLKVFGKNTIVLDGVPTDVLAGREATILQDIIDEYKNNQHRVTLEARDNVAKSFACKAAIKAGDHLREAEMRTLLIQLFTTSMPYVCPHGRPVIVKISINELDRRFMRTS